MTKSTLMITFLSVFFLAVLSLGNASLEDFDVLNRVAYNVN